MKFDYAVRQVGDITVIDLTGHISPDKTFAARRVLHDLISDQVGSGHKKILLNLRDVTFIDSAGVGDLVYSLNMVQKQGGHLRVCNARGRVHLVLCRTQLDSLLHFSNDEPTALEAFSHCGEDQRQSYPNAGLA